MKKLALILFFGFFAFNLFAESIKVGIFQGYTLKKAEFITHIGKYEILLENGVKINLSAGEKVNFQVSGDQIKLIYNGKSYFGYKFTCNTLVLNSEFILNAVSKKKTYQDNFILKVYKGKLVLVNEINIDKYVAGVVSAEVGNKRTLEYYKVQSIISRTYALSNKEKHETEGFHLCDLTHCQVYYGKPNNNDIFIAANATSNFVLTDHNIDLITTVFHSNCGGQTVNSDLVWSKPLPYLVGVRDTFCLIMPNSHWEKKIKKENWVNFLERENMILENDSITLGEMINHFPDKKYEFYEGNESLMRNKDIREKWCLKSAWFNIHLDGEYVILYGRGFGHGVGLCQEGAIRMAELGYNYSEILHFYYNDVHIIDLNYLDFFRE